MSDNKSEVILELKTPDNRDPFWMMKKTVTQPLYQVIEDKVYKNALPLSREDADILSYHYFYKMHRMPPESSPADWATAAFEAFESAIKQLADKLLMYYMKKNSPQSLFEMPSMRFYRQRKQQLLELALKKYFSIQGNEDFHQHHWDKLYQFFQHQCDQQQFSLNNIRDVMSLHQGYSDYLQENNEYLFTT